MRSLKLKFLFVTVLLCSITLVSCNMQDYDIQIPERVFGKLDILLKDLTVEVKDGNILSFEYQVTDAKEQIKLETKIDNNRFLSVLSYKIAESGWADISVFDIDLQEVIDKKNMNIIVEKHAKTLKKKFDASTVGRIADILEGIPELLYNELGIKEYNNESTLSVFYHLAAFNTARRSYESRTSGCQCEINPNYINGASPFTCSEDVMVSANLAYEFISERLAIKRSEGHKFDPKATLKFLKNESGRLVSANKIDKLLSEDLIYFWKNLSVKERNLFFNEINTLSKLPTVTTRSEDLQELGLPDNFGTCWLMGVLYGWECGCCGNYEDFCSLCLFLCWDHDHACQECHAWWCLWACVPESC